MRPTRFCVTVKPLTRAQQITSPSWCKFFTHYIRFVFPSRIIHFLLATISPLVPFGMPRKSTTRCLRRYAPCSISLQCPCAVRPAQCTALHCPPPHMRRLRPALTRRTWSDRFQCHGMQKGSLTPPCPSNRKAQHALLSYPLPDSAVGNVQSARLFVLSKMMVPSAVGLFTIIKGKLLLVGFGLSAPQKVCCICK